MRVLVTGGAGYIGSHTAKAMAEAGHDVVVVDRRAPAHGVDGLEARFVVGDIRDEELLVRLLTAYGIESVAHIAADKSVAESMRDPKEYFDNNTGGTLAVLSSMRRAGVESIVFSSSCSVYGTPDSLPITETSPLAPESPYGESKLLAERLLPWFERCHGIRYAALRYFNVAGASPDGAIGEDWSTSSTLVPAAIKARLGLSQPLSLFGEDYATRDGTAIRDYIHVCDVAGAHVRSLAYLASGGRSDVFNLGTGQGTSVRELLDTLGRLVGGPIPHRIASRRPGDPVAVWADASKAADLLRWRTRYGLEDILRTAWRWHSAAMQGQHRAS